MADYLMGIDYGTGGGKACIMDTGGRVLSYAFREYPIIITHPGWSEHEPQRYWQIACEMIRECIEKANINPAQIRGIGTSSALPCLVMVDENHEPINLAQNLMDRRAVEEVEWLRKTIGEKVIFDLTAYPLEDHPMLVKLLWEKNNRPESFKRIFQALTIDGFVRLKLTGKPTVNFGAADFYGVAWDIRTHRFNEEMLKRVGLPAEIFPPAFPCEDVVGEVTPEAARATGLAPGTPVCGGAVDFNAACVGAGVIDEGDIQMNLGTCGNFGIAHRTTDFLPGMIVCAHAARSRDTYVTIPTTTTGGQLVRWFRDTFAHVEVEMERILGVSSYDVLNLEAENIPPGCDALLMLPYFMGERTPIWDHQARGVFFGLTLSHNRGHLVRSIMEAVAFALYHSFEIIKEAGWPVNFPIVFNEGGARSRLWRKIITDVFNVPTVLLKNRTGAPYGDAILAGVATGKFPDFSVAKEWAEYDDPLEPSGEANALYMDYYQLYRRLYEHVKDDFGELARLRQKYS